MPVHPRLAEYLERKQARYEVVTYPSARSAQAKAARSHTAGRAFAKVVLVIRLATGDEIAAAVPDCDPDALPPFGAPWGLRAWVDRSLLGGPTVTAPAGDPGTAIRMSFAEFRRLAEAPIADFAVPEAVSAARPRASGRRAATGGKRGGR